MDLRQMNLTQHTGVRQGEPISPYLFVLTIERLGHLIQRAISDGDWHPFKLSRNSMPISLLILFARADMDQAGVVKAILDDFCEVSGQKANAAISRILFSKDVNHNRCREISDFLNFVPTPNLGRYLGMPIFHKRTSRSTYKFVLDRMDTRLATWKLNKLSLAARHTLVSSVVSALPSYAMQTVPLPSSTCGEIDKRCRNFLWGSTPGACKIHLVAWDNVCWGCHKLTIKIRLL